MDIVYEEKLNGLNIRIVQDECFENPSSWDDHNIFLVGYHRDFWVDAPKVYRRDAEGKRIEGDKGRIMFDKEDLIKYYTLEEVCPKCESDNINLLTESNFGLKKTYKCRSCDAKFKKAKELRPELFKDYHVIALSAYIHSGVKLYLGSHQVCQWDSCQVGAVLVAKEEARTIKQALKYAEGLVENWNDSLSGNVYGYQIQDADGQEIDACYGFYGDYEKGALVEAKAIVENMTKKGACDHKGQLLLQF